MDLTIHEIGDFHSVITDERPQGSIVSKDGEEPKVFFERFIGELCFQNGIIQEGNPYFPFSSRDIRLNFNFFPALVLIRFSHPDSLNDQILANSGDEV